MKYSEVTKQANYENSLVAVILDDFPHEKDPDEFFGKEIRRMKVPETFKRRLYITTYDNCYSSFVKDVFHKNVQSDWGLYNYEAKSRDNFDHVETCYPQYIFFNIKSVRTKLFYTGIFYHDLARSVMLDKNHPLTVVFMDDENNPEVWGREDLINFFCKERGNWFNSNPECVSSYDYKDPHISQIIKTSSSLKNLQTDTESDNQTVTEEQDSLNGEKTAPYQHRKPGKDITSEILNSEKPRLFIVKDLSEIKKNSLRECLIRILYTGSVLDIKNKPSNLNLIDWDKGNGNEDYGLNLNHGFYAWQLIDLINLLDESNALFPPSQYSAETIMLREQGKTQTEIANQLGTTQSTISKILKMLGIK